MKRLLAASSPRCRNLRCFGTWSVLIILTLAAVPFLLDVLSRGIDWMIELFPHSDKLWEQPSWFC